MWVETIFLVTLCAAGAGTDIDLFELAAAVSKDDTNDAWQWV